MSIKSFLHTVVFSFLSVAAFAFNETPTPAEGHAAGGATETHAAEAHGENHDAHATTEAYDPADAILNHIGNANEMHFFGHYSLPLPVILWDKAEGLKTFMSSVFHHGAMAHEGFVADHGVVKKVLDPTFPKGEVALEGHGDHLVAHEKQADGSEKAFVTVQGKKYELEKASGLLEATSFYDFSISKNVLMMLVASLLLLFIFVSVANRYKKSPNAAPRGFWQNTVEVMVGFITDEVARPMIGEKKYRKYLPLLLTIFFFILMNNLLGLIPIFGTNVTGNIATTAALAIITFLVTNLSGNKDYWGHIFWMPGVPVPMKIFLAPIEFLGVFTKPISLMIRLFANITAGHIIILALVNLIFVFGNVGESTGGAVAGTLLAFPMTLFLNVIEIIVAFIQAFIFTILTASYIGAATEEHHHAEHH